ncbi:unnamed protein product [Owenia fusiformis]|uniref:Mitochondria-eating protein n=1 Tax=Owenia fusiformis TaxID=6347 RepID=A0A8J1T6J7_OWEFU|nr:unnamed protein product [Owenia fusiformis]
MQSLMWKNKHWILAPPVEQNKMQTEEINPDLAIRKVALLFEGKKFEECASLLNKLRPEVVYDIIKHLPNAGFIEAIPQTLSIIEALCLKVYCKDSRFPTKSLPPDKIISKLVEWFARIDDASLPVNLNQDHFMPACRNVVSVLVNVDPRVRNRLHRRSKSFVSSLEGLGNHALVDTSEKKLMNLHDALKIEFEKTVSQYKGALGKLEELRLSNKIPVSSSVNKGPAPSVASHQRMMQMSLIDIQERIFKNKSLLNVIEPAITNQYLTSLLIILEQRIDADKAVLNNYNVLRKEIPSMPHNPIVAPTFQQFSQGYQRMLDLIQDVSPWDDEEGFYSDDTDPDIISISGKNLGAGSVPATSRESLVKLPLTHPPQRSVSNPVNPAHFRGSPKAQRPESDRVIKPPSLKGIPVNGASNGSVPLSAPIPPGTESKEMAELRSEVKTLKAELNKARETINRLQAKEKSLADRLSEQAIKQLEKGTKFEDLNLGENRPTQLIRRYGNLHSGTRVDALDALDSLPDIADYDDLKAKLLFSVVVLSFRSVQATLDEMRQTVRQTLYLPNENSPSSPDPIVKDVEDTISVYLRKTVDRFDFKNNVEEVCSQVYATLYDYPSLKSCFELRDYVEECVKLSWALSVQIPHFVIDYDASMFNPDLHTRFHSSNPESTAIQGFLWPSLREGQDGQCVYKGVVIT